jgi:hypothetical protein
MRFWTLAPKEMEEASIEQGAWTTPGRYIRQSKLPYFFLVAYHDEGGSFRGKLSYASIT